MDANDSKEIELVTLTLPRDQMLHVAMAFCIMMEIFNKEPGGDRAAARLWRITANFCATPVPPKESITAVTRMILELNKDSEERTARLRAVFGPGVEIK